MPLSGRSHLPDRIRFAQLPALQPSASAFHPPGSACKMEMGPESQLRRMPSFVLSLAWKRYLKKLQTDPLMTKALTSAVLSVLSDIVAKQVSKLPVKSSAVIKELTVGLLLRGPVIHYFHSFLDNTVFSGRDQTSAKIVVGKLFIDQFIFSPAFTALYFYFSGLSDDESLKNITKRLRNDLLKIMQSNWAVWIPANFVSYYCVPLDLRVLFGNIVGLFWNAYLISVVSSRRTIEQMNANSSS